MLGGGDVAPRDRFPFFDAAMLGGGSLFSGSDTLRGYWPNRFIGDRSFYANADARLYLSRFFLALPGEWGLIGFGDVGRVWLEGVTSDTWHSSVGGGIWIGLLSRSNAVAITFARSDERKALFVRAGFSF
jgi:hemolysin activation/secretion protein